MDAALRFVPADPAEAAGGLDADTVHLWRMPYERPLGRAPLIDMLAAYLGVPAAAVVLGEGAKGKPRLQPPAPASEPGHPAAAGAAPPPGGTRQPHAPAADAALPVQSAAKAEPGDADAALSFNWSHSCDYALLALARGTALGVDIEQVRERPRVLDLARRFFDPGEADALAKLHPAERTGAFTALWCAKEAVLKAAGEGLSFGLARLAFTLRTGADWSLVRVDPALGRRSAWRLAGFDVLAGYRGAVAWRGGPRRIFAFEPKGRVARAGARA